MMVVGQLFSILICDQGITVHPPVHLPGGEVGMMGDERVVDSQVFYRG